MSTREERYAAIDAAVFRTITAADWAAMFRRERAGVRNAARDHIHAKILDLNSKQDSEIAQKWRTP